MSDDDDDDNVYFNDDDAINDLDQDDIIDRVACIITQPGFIDIWHFETRIREGILLGFYPMATQYQQYCIVSVWCSLCILDCITSEHHTQHFTYTTRSVFFRFFFVLVVVFVVVWNPCTMKKLNSRKDLDSGQRFATPFTDFKTFCWLAGWLAGRLVGSLTELRLLENYTKIVLFIRLSVRRNISFIMMLCAYLHAHPQTLHNLTIHT